MNPDIHDLEAFERSTLRLRRLGFVGRAAVHPLQLAPIHAVFVPDVDAVRNAPRLIDAYDAVTAAGHGVSVDDHGRMLDETVVRRSRRVVAMAQRDTQERR